MPKIRPGGKKLPDQAAHASNGLNVRAPQPDQQGSRPVEKLTPKQRWDEARDAAKTRWQAENER
jgi:hypothetical protein